jgi:hypothetical protein
MLIVADATFASAKVFGVVMGQVGGEMEGASAVEGGRFGNGVRGGFVRLLLFGLMIRYAIKIDTFRLFTVNLLLLFHRPYFI